MSSFTLKFKLLVASFFLFGSIASLFYNQITLNSKVDYATSLANAAILQKDRAFETKSATTSPTLVPAVSKAATKSAVPSKAIIKK